MLNCPLITSLAVLCRFLALYHNILRFFEYSSWYNVLCVIVAVRRSGIISIYCYFSAIYFVVDQRRVHFLPIEIEYHHILNTLQMATMLNGISAYNHAIT